MSFAYVADNAYGYTSSPLDLAGYDASCPLSSTLDSSAPTGSPVEQAQTGTSISSVLSGISNIVLGGIALSRIPATKLAVQSTPSNLSVQAGSVVSPNSINSVSIIFILFILAIIGYLVFKKG